ncbi:SGNH/GDSL hydrolase family protein [Cryobacterium sp. PAMC25264]|nr:SGNH/GDSL hydrolase family protein [Cryobacterium sp. PAMC25264]
MMSPDFGAGDIDPGSWVMQVLGKDYSFAGGWAVPGSHTAAMLAHVVPVDADVLLIFAGTNDVFFGDDIATTEANLVGIADTVDARRVVISAITPLDPKPGLAERYNETIQVFAETQGWDWIDPTEDIRNGETYVVGLTDDGLRPNTEGEALMGQTMKLKLDELLRD